MARLEQVGTTFNEDKCEFEVTETKLIGNIIDYKSHQELSSGFK